jgi:hypothetical protein
MKLKQEKIKNISDKLATYASFMGGITMFILPAVFNFIPIVNEWKVNFWLITCLSFFLLFMEIGLLVSLFLTRNDLKKITSGPKKLQDISPKKAKNLRNILGVIALVGFGFVISWILPYSIKGINYLYIENKEPVTQTDLVINADDSGGAAKFTIQNAEFEKLGKLEMWFESARFKEGRYYEITMIPNTKYILERKIFEE